MPAETEPPIGVDLTLRIVSKTEVEAFLTPSGSYPRSAPAPVWTTALIGAADSAAVAFGMKRKSKGNPTSGSTGTRHYSGGADTIWEPL